MFRSVNNAWLGGVCGGLGKRFGMPPGLFRLAFIIGGFFTLGTIAILYFALLICCRDERSGLAAYGVEYNPVIHGL